MLNVNVKTNYSSLCDYVAEDISSYIQQNPHAILCLAGGHTPIGAYEKLTHKIHSKSIDISNITFIGLDEWIGINGDTVGSSRQILDKNLFHPLQVKKENIWFFDGTVLPIEKEKERILNKLNEHGGIDYLLLGVGLNGHLGFNEPNVQMDEDIHVVKLDEITKEIASKYFEHSIGISEGITIGMNLILSSQKVILMASGEKKAEIIQKTLKSEVDPQTPSTMLKKHKNALMALDNDAAKDLRRDSTTLK